MKIENLLPANYAKQHTIQNKYEVSFSTILNLSTEEISLAGTHPASGTKSTSKSHKLDDDVIQISELEHKYCSLCGSEIDEKGNCPICIIPIFISGDPQENNQDIPPSDNLQETWCAVDSLGFGLSRNSRFGK